MNEEIIEYKIFRIDTAARKFTVKNHEIALSNKEFSLIVYFLKNLGRVLTRTQILHDVWDCNICCATNTIDVHISNLRQKIKRYSGIMAIKTVHCIGYMIEIDNEKSF